MIAVGGCNKYFEAHAGTSCGVLTAMCLTHRQNIALNILKTPESQDHYFSFMTMYYPDKGPTDVVTIHRLPLSIVDFVNNANDVSPRTSSTVCPFRW